MKKTVTIIILCCISAISAAQINTDSLWKIWNDTAQVDTVRLYAIDELAWDARYKNTDSAIRYATFEYEYANQRNLKSWTARACNTLGVSYYAKSDYPRAIEWHQKGFAINKEMNSKGGMATSYNNLGNIYSDQGDYVTALKYYQKALELVETTSKQKASLYHSNIGSIYLQKGLHPKALEEFQKALALSEELNDKIGIAVAYNNIGIIYDNAGDTAKALEYYNKSVDINKELGDKQGVAESYLNIGILKKAQGKYGEALEYQRKSLALEIDLDNRQGIANAYAVIGEIYAARGDTHLALENFRKGLTLSETLGTRDKTAQAYINIGNVYLNQKKYKFAEKFGRDGLRASEELGILTYQREASKLLYEIYKNIGQNNDALKYHEKFLALTDSIETTETNKRLDQMEFAKIMLADSLKNEQEKVQVKKAHQEEVELKDTQRNMAFYVGAGILLLAATLWTRLRYVRKTRAAIKMEKDRSDNLLLNILPAEVAEELKRFGKAEARDFDSVSVLFTDFKGFTSISEKMSAKDLVAEINYCFEAFDKITAKYKIEKIKTIGDSYMAAGGLPVPGPDTVKNTVLAALEMQNFIQTYQSQKDIEHRPAFQMRAGIHTGPVVAGIVGVKKFQYDIWGDAVNTASRMESSGVVGQVNISETTYELIKDEPIFRFQSRGKVEAKGKGELGMYFVELSEKAKFESAG